MIEVSHLSYRYGRKRPAVFENVSFSLEPGRIYGLLGKNGTGKSTLLYLLSGLLFPQEGSVKYRGLEMRERRPEALGDLYLLPETFRLPNMSLKNYVRLHAPFYPNFSVDDMNRYLDTFEMEHDCKLQSLSMGQKKKVFMSFALATNTRVLIMDEPTNGLDIPSKSQWRKIIASGMTDDKMMLFSTHQVRDIEQVLDHVLIIDQSQVLLNASLGEVASRLAFRPMREGDQPLLAQTSAMGTLVVTPALAGEETQVDLELLFNATLQQPQAIRQLFGQ